MLEGNSWSKEISEREYWNSLKKEILERFWKRQCEHKLIPAASSPRENLHIKYAHTGALPGVQWCNTIRPNKCLLINGNICASKCDFLFPLFACLGWPTGPLSESRRHSSRSLARSKASESKVLESKAPIRTDGTLALSLSLSLF